MERNLKRRLARDLERNLERRLVRGPERNLERRLARGLERSLARRLARMILHLSVSVLNGPFVSLLYHVLAEINAERKC